jgi:hypothetical protein
MEPYAKTATRRREAAARARQALAAYVNLTKPASRPGHNATKAMRVARLLRAKACIDHALALETRDHLGAQSASPGSYLADANTSLGALYPIGDEK